MTELSHLGHALCLAGSIFPGVTHRWGEQADHHLHLDTDSVSPSRQHFSISVLLHPGTFSPPEWMLALLQFWKVIYRFIFLPFYIGKRNVLDIAFR